MKKITLPGLIDMHVHLRSPGQTDKEDFETGTAAAYAGGFRIIADMPNNKEPIFTLDRLVRKMDSAKGKTKCKVLFYFGSTGDNLGEFEKVYGLVAGLKLYLDKTTGGFILDAKKLESVFRAWKSDKSILLHCEDEHIGALMDTVRKTGKRIHVCHIHSKKVLDAIMRAKKEGLPVTCGVTPHHLFLTDADGKKLGPYGMMKPPLMDKQTVGYLWGHIRDIDAVESDHAPHTREEKESGNPPFGVPGLETTLPLLLTAFSKGRISLAEIKRLLYTGPAQILGLGNVDTGSITIDMDKTYVLHGTDMKTKCKWTPFEGLQVTGKIL